MSLPRVLIALAIPCHLAACQPAQRTEADHSSPADAREKDDPVLPIADPALDRRALLLAVAEAASAAALGEDDREVQRGLDGKRFTLRLRFGCGGSAASRSTEPRRWTFDERSRVQRFHVAPDVDLATPLVKSIAPAGFEAAEGFRVHRPWLLRASCPALSPPKVPGSPPASPPAAEAQGIEPAQPEPRIAIAQFYTAADPRTHRRDRRAYEATRTMAADEAPSALGYDLVLSGRLRALPGGRVIACVPAAAEAPPSCIVSAAFDQVAIEAPDSKEIVAQWAMG